MAPSENNERKSLLQANREQNLQISRQAEFYGSTGSIVSTVSSLGALCPDIDRDNLETRTYWYRWYILGLFSLVAAMENIAWNTWGPIENSCRAVFGWSSGTVSLLSDWGAITFVLFVFPSAWVLDVRGLRIATILASLFLVIGTGLRCITSEPEKATYLIHAGQFMIGVGGPVGQSSATVLSSTWFPKHQRTTATAVASLASYCGTALSFFIGPHMVTDIATLAVKKGQPGYIQAVAKISDEIMILLYVQCGVCVGLLFLVLVSFPAKPPIPPTATASVERMDYKDGLKRLIKNPQFQLIAFLYGLTTGVYSAWCSDLALNLHAFKISDETASWLGFWAVVAGAVSGILLSAVADHLGALKLLLILMFIVASAGFGVFTLICAKVIPWSMVLMYMTSVLGGLCLNGSIPLFFELAVESSYPVAEGINTGFMTFSNNVYCLIFLSLPLIPGVGTKWMNWFLFATCLICFPMLLLFKERYRRSEQDNIGATHQQPPVENEDPVDDKSLDFPGSIQHLSI